jgi:HPt (histidine-containing phosphotransfer) domain-containing protein
VNISASPAEPGARASYDPAPDRAPTQALDSAAGLHRMMGDEAMYLRVLARFRSDYADTVVRLRAALAGGDATLAHRIAHTIKGAAAMIEARGLRALASNIEQLLRSGAPADPALRDLRKLLERLEAELAQVMVQIDALVAAPAAASSTAAEGALESDIAQLRALLDVGDSGAQDIVVAQRAGLHARLGAARMAELESAVASFDYERAVCLLDALPGASGAHGASG